jgi:hypothetical protein
MLTPATGAAKTGRLNSWPNTFARVSGSAASWMTRMFSLIRLKASTEAMNEPPVPDPPIPGTWPAQALPLQTGQTLHPSIIFLALSLISFISI